MTITIKDVIANCELAYEYNDRKPSAIHDCAQRMLDQHKPTPDSHVGQLLGAITSSTSPRIYLNAITLKLRYLEAADEEFVAEETAQSA